ncbi:MAG: hypothetical protein U0531_07755 [Dehalococcoidia bacterium]
MFTRYATTPVFRTERARNRPALVVAVMLFAVAATAIFAPAAEPAAAHGNTPLKVRFHQVHAVEESDGLGSDEIYVVFFIADLSGLVPVGRTVRTEIFQDMDTGERRTRTVPHLWGGAAGAPLPNADNLIILGAVMENDGSDAGEVVVTVQGLMIANLIGAVAPGRTRADIVADLRTAMNNALDVAAFASAPLNPDDRLGGATEFRLTHANLDSAAAGVPVELTQRFRDNGEDATYRVTIRITN